MTTKTARRRVRRARQARRRRLQSPRRRSSQSTCRSPTTSKTKFIGGDVQERRLHRGADRHRGTSARKTTRSCAPTCSGTPTDNFSLRFTYNDEQKRGTDPKIHRMTRYDGSRVYAYNIMLGVFQDAANAALRRGSRALPRSRRQRRRHPAAQPRQGGGTATRQFRRPRRHVLAAAAANRHRHALHRPSADRLQPGHAHDELPGGSSARRRSNYRTALMPDTNFGPGQVGKWQTKSDSMEDGITADLKYATLTARVGHHGQLELRGDPVDLGAGPTPGHRLRRHRVLGHDGRLRAPTARTTRWSSICRARRSTSGSIGSAATTRSRRRPGPAPFAGACTSGRSTAAPPTTPQRRFRRSAHQRRGCGIRAADRYVARPERPHSAGLGQPCRRAEPC